MILSFANTLTLVGYESFSNQIKLLSSHNYNQWYETYYKTHPEEYPDPERIYNNFMKVANGYRGNNVLEGFVFLAPNNIIAGTITLNLDDLAPEKSYSNLCINNVYVLPEYRGQGIAKKLINHMMSHVMETKSYLSRINLFCEIHLIPFYKSLGWSLVSSIPQLQYWYEMEFKIKNGESVSSKEHTLCLE